MQLELIIGALRQRCPGLGTRVAGAAQFRLLPESASLQVPFAFVLPLDDAPDPPTSPNVVRQYLKEGFAVVVALDNSVDERGQSASHGVHDMRAALWRALLGWKPTSDHNGIAYEGGNLLQLDRRRLWFQFEFSAAREISPEDGWQQGDIDALPHLQGVDIKVDVIDPIFDPNLSSTGPDGRIEQTAQVNFP